MKSRKKKTGITVTAVILLLALGLAGTYAWSGGDGSSGDIGGEVKPDVRLHDDYDQNQTGQMRDRDIYVENTGESALYVRIRLDEYLEIGEKQLIGGSDLEDKTTWEPHIMDSGDTAHCGAGFHDYFRWEMGNDTPISYAGGVKNWYDDAGGKPERNRQSGTAAVITLAEYINAPDNAKPTGCWIMDEADGYAYWYTQLKEGEATGLLLNGIEVGKELDESYTYKVNAKLEAVTESDLLSWTEGADTIEGKKADRASVNAARLLKDISPNYIKITEGMNLTTPPASQFDGNRDGYLTKKEYKKYGEATGTVKISETTFPDEAFRKYVLTVLDIDGNKTLTQNELAATVLDVSNQGIASLKGIEHFTDLESLNCSGNKLTGLNLSNNTKLSSVTADNQTVELELKYDAGLQKYKSVKGLFVAGTSFGTAGIEPDEETGALLIDRKSYAVGMNSTFSVPLSYGNAEQAGRLEGILTVTGNKTQAIIRGAEAGEVVELENQDGSLTEWVVLTKTDTQAELITKKMVTTMQYASADHYQSWSNSMVRTFLNETFYNTLGEEIKDVIKEETELKTPTAYNHFEWLETTSDKIYLLTEGGTSGMGTGKVITPSGIEVALEFLQCDSVAVDMTTAGYWWLRSPRFNSIGAGEVRCIEGTLYDNSVWSVRGVRPALTINLQ